MSQGSRYQKVKPEEDRRRGPKPRKHFDLVGGVNCKSCFELRNKNIELQQEITRLKAVIASPEKTLKKDTTHAPSSRVDFKANSKEESKAKRGGAKLGHKGFGRTSSDISTADDVTTLPMQENCEECRCELKQKDIRQRTIIEAVPIIAKKVIYNCPRGSCPKCKKIYPTYPPALKKCLYGNSLISQAAVLHYVHGITMGKVLNIFGENVTLGGLVDCFHRLGKIAESAKPFLVNEYRNSLARHADETGWRTDGHSGYAWLFCTSVISIFEFRDTRSSRVAREILGTEKLGGVLNVDRYGGYNKMPVDLQYCYAHLLREIEKLEKEFPGEIEISDFVSTFAVLLAQAMKLRGRTISDEEYLNRASGLKLEMETVLLQNWKHLGIQRIQNIFHEKKERLYHWTKSREIAADNNRAERELRPTVIARKVSFGSQSDAGAKSRSSIMTLLHTVKKRLKEESLEEWLTDALNKVAQNPSLDIATLIPQ
jgi:transposase